MERHFNLKSISRLLFSLARSSLGGIIIGWSFAHMSFLIPVDRLYETELVVAFHHPKPSYPTHILIVPKRKIRSVLALTEADMPVVQDVLAATKQLVAQLELEEGGFRLMVNGGAYQDVAQIHWHLIVE